MNRRAVIFAFVILLATSLNFGFFVGQIDDPAQHDIRQLFAALAVSLIATVVKLRDRTHAGAFQLAASLVADLQLIAATVIWTYATPISTDGLTSATTTVIVSMAGGALAANLISVLLLIYETTQFQGDSA